MNNKLGSAILKIVSKRYEPSTLVNRRFKRLDLSFKTDEEGRPVLLFLGERQADGNIKGERYGRVINANTDHWEHKGKAT